MAKIVKVGAKKPRHVPVRLFLILSLGILMHKMVMLNQLMLHMYDEKSNTDISTIAIESESTKDKEEVLSALNVGLMEKEKQENTKPITRQTDNDKVLRKNLDLFLQTYKPQVKPAFQCYQPFANYGKVVFIHVYKTAGSTLRGFFLQYAKKCSKSAIMITSCNADAESIRRQRWEPCTLKEGWERNGKRIGTKSHVRADDWMAKGMDIIGGHFLIDSTFDLKGDNNVSLQESGVVQTVTFVRNPIDKFVSSVLYKNRGYDMVWYIDKIKQMMDDRSDDEYSNSYADYLITPLQLEKFKSGAKPSIEYQVELMCKNLVDFNVIIGVTERMPESLEILRYLMDSKKTSKLNSHFDKFSNKLHYNKSPNKVSTKSVIKEIKKHEGLYDKLVEYLKYDTILVSFAKKIHDKQFKYVLQQSKS